MPTKVSMMFNAITPPQDGAVQRVGGWSESWWQAGLVSPTDDVVQRLILARTPLLCSPTSIVGVRTTQYEIPNVPGNSLRPTRSRLNREVIKGALNQLTDILQMSVNSIAFASQTGSQSKFKIGGIPDNMVTEGAFQPTQQYRARMDRFRSLLQDDAWGFYGQSRTVQSSLIMGMTDGVLTLANALPDIVVGNFLRINRAMSTNNLPFSGGFRVTAVAGNTYTLAGLANVSLIRAGSARQELLAFNDIDEVVFRDASPRKVGRPFFQLRGRASKRR